ncbi:hypothetical protein G6F65_023236 [Rhizopus arrhizus]|nr:hypothetical protein G6F65_023236 [Rhizopus arrhizus]
MGAGARRRVVSPGARGAVRAGPGGARRAHLDRCRPLAAGRTAEQPDRQRPALRQRDRPHYADRGRQSPVPAGRGRRAGHSPRRA